MLPSWLNRTHPSRAAWFPRDQEACSDPPAWDAVQLSLHGHGRPCAKLRARARASWDAVQLSLHGHRRPVLHSGPVHGHREPAGLLPLLKLGSFSKKGLRLTQVGFPNASCVTATKKKSLLRGKKKRRE